MKEKTSPPFLFYLFKPKICLYRKNLVFLRAETILNTEKKKI